MADLKKTNEPELSEEQMSEVAGGDAKWLRACHEIIDKAECKKKLTCKWKDDTCKPLLG